MRHKISYGQNSPLPKSKGPITQFGYFTPRFGTRALREAIATAQRLKIISEKDDTIFAFAGDDQYFMKPLKAFLPRCQSEIW